MKTFVILAAGRGTRIGRTDLHKALVPLGGKAVLSHLLDLAPADAEVVVCTGHLHHQIEAYLKMAHPHRKVRTMYVEGWDTPGVGGPGWSLAAARPHVQGDLIFTSCDTLWSPLEYGDGSWLGVSMLPTGTALERWCRIIPDGDGIIVADKTAAPAGGWVHTGMGQIAEADLGEFWDGLLRGSTVHGERQMSAGFGNVTRIGCVPIDWLDVGDADAYQRAVELHDGYDWSKTNEATYLLPEEGRVVKFHADPSVALAYAQRAVELKDSSPPLLGAMPNWTAIGYVHGGPVQVSMAQVLGWAESNLWRPRDQEVPFSSVHNFYRGKVYQRVEMLPAPLRERCYQALALVRWNALCEGVVPSTMHGDLTFGNMIQSRNGLRAFDWRPRPVTWGDKRYDLAKLWSGCRVDWESARRGDFRPPARGPADEEVLAAYCAANDITDVPVIAGLCLLSSAPLHAAPFDEILVTRGIKLLEEFA
jgi:hypothetical protein